jgi:hypothetical protein
MFIKLHRAAYTTSDDDEFFKLISDGRCKF